METLKNNNYGMTQDIRDLFWNLSKPMSLVRFFLENSRKKRKDVVVVFLSFLKSVRKVDPRYRKIPPFSYTHHQKYI